MKINKVKNYEHIWSVISWHNQGCMCRKGYCTWPWVYLLTLLKMWLLKRKCKNVILWYLFHPISLVCNVSNTHLPFPAHTKKAHYGMKGSAFIKLEEALNHASLYVKWRGFLIKNILLLLFYFILFLCILWILVAIYCLHAFKLWH